MAYVYPETLPPPSDPRSPLSPTHVKQWKEQGYLLINDLFPESVVQTARDDIWDFIQKSNKGDIGDFGLISFPTVSQMMNSITLYPTLISAVEQLLGTDEIFMSQSEVWPKYHSNIDNPRNNQDQRIHMDYPNHTLVHPPEWDTPEAVALIIYFSHESECGGGTAVVPRTGPEDPAYEWPYQNLPGFGGFPWINNRDYAEKYFEQNHPQIHEFRQQLYAREKKVAFTPGTILFYRHDIWHRGTPLKPNSRRLVQNLVFKKHNNPWFHNWNPGWATNMYSEAMTLEKIVALSSVQQRGVLGFPRPGSSYWTKRTFEAVSKRYEPLGMDMSPYRPQ